MVNVSTETQLRDAIFAANAGGDQTIVFTGNIVLTRSLPMITASMTFNGNGFDLDADNQGRAFFVVSGTVAINNLTIVDAVASGGAGGDSTGEGGGGGGGGLGAGAAVFVNTGATVTLTNVGIENATALGGQGGAGGSAVSGGVAGAGGGGLGGNGGFANGNGGGGGGYEGNGGNGAIGGGGGGGEFGNGGNGVNLENGGGGGGGGQEGNGGSSTGAGGGGGGGAINPGADGGATTGGAGGSPQGGNGGDTGVDGQPGLALGGGGGGGGGADGGAGGLSGGGGGGGDGGDAAGNGGIGGGGGGASSLTATAGNGGDFGGGGGSVTVAGGSGGFGGGGGGAELFDAAGGAGGFGAGGGGGVTGGAGGSYGGAGGGGEGASGGGGAALGGAIFVRQGGTLVLNNPTFDGAFTLLAGGTDGVGGATAGVAHGALMYIDAITILSIGTGQTLTLGPDLAPAGGLIAGAGLLRKAGGGTLVLAEQSSGFTGGTEIESGTLRLEVANAIGTGEVVFTHGAQTLSLDNDVFVAGAFQNLIEQYGQNDVIDLSEVDPTTAELFYHAGTGVLDVGVGGGVTYSFTFFRPASIDFVIKSNGSGGSQIVLGEGVTITGTGGADRIDAEHTVTGEPLPTKSADLIDARGGDDKVSGLGGNDFIIGGNGDDEINGGKGDDRIEGGLGKNQLKGGKGEDTFVLSPDFGSPVGKGGAKADGHARILDFSDTNRDWIELDAEIFAAIGPALDEGEFRFGLKAKDEDDHILYHANSGRLLFDEDGKGGADAVQIARLDKQLDLGTDHFLIA